MIDWQHLIVYAVVAWAAWSVVRRMIATTDGLRAAQAGRDDKAAGPACSACAGHADRSSATGLSLEQLGELPRRPRGR